MNRNRNLNLVLALAAGFLGGFLSRSVALPPVRAQTRPADALEVRAQRFSVVDPTGRVIASFTRAPIAKQEGYNIPLPTIALVDPEGHELWSAGGYGFKPLAENPR